LTGATYDGIYTYVGDETDGSGAVGQDSHGNYFLFSENGGIPDGQNLNNFKAEALPLCFAAGTLIRTPRGDVPVEQLNAGDLVETSTGASRPVKWIGHRVIDCRKHGPKAALPIRIAADAFGPDRPSQDLVVTPGHSICVDLIGETFVSAGNLVNGASIAQVEVDEIDCWHVELDSHDVLLANNLPAESYLDVGNRGFFADDGATLDPDEVFKNAARTYDDFCRPRMESAALSFVRSRLVARARAIGWTPSYEMDLHLVVDGDVRRPLSEGNGAVFLFPASARDVRLMSNTFVPACA
jgi:Hint domain